MHVRKLPWNIRVGALLRRGFSLLWPRTCPLCGSVLRLHEHAVCLHCMIKFPHYSYLEGSDRNIVFMGAPGNMVHAFTWFAYSTMHESHKLIHYIKYSDSPVLARRLGREFGCRVAVNGVPDFDVILPVPIHMSKRLQRGYNQVDEIAVGMRDVLGVRIGNNLIATRSHISQTQMSKTERVENLHGIFAIRNPHELNGKRVALLDDVITTGATMAEATRTLLEACNPSAILHLSLCRTQNQ